MLLEDTIIDGVYWMMDNGQAEVAEWMIDKMLSDYPNHSQAHHEKATIAHRKNDYITAGVHFLRAVELEPGNAEYRKSLGDFYYVSQGKSENALEQYRKVIGLEPNDQNTLLTAGHLCVALRYFDEAADYYRRVLEDQPGHPDATQYLDQLTKIQSKQKSPSLQPYHDSNPMDASHCDSLDRFFAVSQIDNIDPNDAHVHNELGVKSYEDGNIEKALYHYQTAVQLMPENIVFQKNLADIVWNEKRDARGAMKVFVEVLKRDPQDIEALLSCGQICMVEGKIEDGRDFIELALSAEPWNQDAKKLLDQLDSINESTSPAISSDELYARAQSKARSGNRQGAIDDLNLLVSNTPDYPIAYNDLGVLYYETGNKAKSLASYEKAYELAPVQPNIIKNLADFYLFEEKKVEEAMRLYLKVLENSPEDIDCLMAIAMVCAMLGKQEEAVVFYQRVLRLEPWNQDARQALEKLGGEGNFSKDYRSRNAIG